MKRIGKTLTLRSPFKVATPHSKLLSPLLAWGSKQASTAPASMAALRAQYVAKLKIKMTRFMHNRTMACSWTTWTRQVTISLRSKIQRHFKIAKSRFPSSGTSRPPASTEPRKRKKAKRSMPKFTTCSSLGLTCNTFFGRGTWRWLASGLRTKCSSGNSPTSKSFWPLKSSLHQLRALARPKALPRLAGAELKGRIKLQEIR